MELSIEDSVALCTRALTTAGFTSEQCDQITPVLLYAQLRNPSGGQGFAKLRGGNFTPNPDSRPMASHTDTSRIYLDGGDNPGITVMQRLVDLSLETLSAGSPLVLATSTNNHPSVAASSTGALGFYANRMAQQGYISICMSKPSVPLVAPYGSTDRCFSTNPLAMGFPSTDAPVVVDLTTAASSYFAVKESAQSGTPLAPGAAYSAKGNETTNASDVISGGALRPFAGARGSAIAFAVEAFAAAFGASYGGMDREKGWFNLIIGITPDSSAAAQVGSLCSLVSSLAPHDPSVPVRFPGERGYLAEKIQRSKGTLTLDDSLYKDLVFLSNS